MLKILCRDLPLDKIPFGGKMRILQFYTEESEGKKKKPATIEPTGEKSSQG